MPSIHPHLKILSPSPTTISFTVTTSPPRQSFAAHCIHWFLLGIRALIALVTLLFLASRYLQSEILLSVYISEKLDLIPWSYLGTSSAAILFLTLRRFHIGRSCFFGLFDRTRGFPICNNAHSALQRNLFLRYERSASRLAVFPPIICCQLLLDSFQRPRSETSLSTRLSGASKSDTISQL